ncbi:far upstream element-binding protein 3 isoform X1 [Microplitis demolitor]|uniref:far upstream element-binding protein 3 isoform X1 n=1 Tax=Microplitis demolitor TaxID=69319 RepID=UPI0004CCCC1B|nr:far upstream element-binding protein 3 isoform X1 [Microplitis demolitor]XP_014300436.1 far upstream element-binding protein 3 isoform X1 [Microplitis demolitor]
MSDYSAVAPPQNFSQSSAFAAALQRAKQIAAKINPGGNQNTDGGIKRSLEDSTGFSDEFTEPEAKKLAQDPLIGMRGGPLGGIGDNGGNRGAPVSSPTSSLGGICNEDIRVPDKMVGLIIGRGGEQITRLQSETGCKIQMAPESGGLPERLCTLTGSREAVNRAKDLVLSIVNQRCRSEGGMGDMNMPNPNNSGGGGGGGGGGGSSGGGSSGGSGGGGGGPMMSSNSHPGSVEIMIPGPKVGLIIGKGGETIKQLQEKSGAKMVVIQDGPSQEQEKPLRITGDPQKVEYAKQLVYELIAEKEMQMFHRGPRNNDRNSFSNDNGFNNHGSSSAPPNNGDGCEVLVPRAAVGVVIGKGGDMIKKIQSETGARVQFQQGREEGPGDRKCLLSGKPQAVEQARQRIQELIDSVTRRDDRPPAGRSGSRGNGFGGGNNNGGGGGRPNEYGGWDRRQGGGSMQDKIEATYNVPSTKCGIIIGKGGETIKQINQQTGAHCELDRRNPGTETEKIFIIRGSPEQVEHAKRIFNEKLGVQNDPMHDFQGGANAAYAGAQGAIGYNPTWNAGAGYQTWPTQAQPTDASATAQPVQINPQTGQPDYSAQWAEYYRSLGMHREAELIEQQSKQAKADPAQQQAATAVAAVATPGAAATAQATQQPQPNQQAQPQNATQNGGQADYSAQWAEYYRSIGKIKEAEAIEAQMKAGKNNQMGQTQMQPQAMQGQAATPAAPAPANAFPQAYGAYPGMNPGSTPGNYYAPGAGAPQQQNPGQQNPGFPTGYQNYSYSQPNADN